MRIARYFPFRLAFIFAMLAALNSFAADDVPGTRVKGKSSKEPPPPSRPGNPFPRNPDPPLKNPLRDDKKNLNPKNDPDVQKGIQKNYREYQERQKEKEKATQKRT